ncbi:hypothetical protein [Microvirga rosea]|uniref:hypothetical protein n=1 Tax=Microvirga rosea TaxID=2715425 RepID=UPI001D0A55E9|nr:hypothetical protein [Microvirga rosea]MCB8819118.1 hypothetical protein [Microvirga rosea]
MTTLYISNTRTNSVLLDPTTFSDLQVTATGTLTTVNAAVEGYPGATVAVDGSIFSQMDAISFAGMGCAITVGATGIVRGNNNGVYLGDDANTVINNGQISGSLNILGTAAVVLDGSDNYIFNAGLFSGYYGILGTATQGDGNLNHILNEGRIQATDTGILLTAINGLVPSTRATVDNPLDYGVFNSGTIIAGLTGVDIRLAGSVTNTGLIKASLVGITFNTGDTFLRNSGEIIAQTAVFGSIDGDTLLNSGHLQGAILLNDGADLYDGREGTVTDAINLGDGNDTAYGGAGVETLLGGAGRDSLFGYGGSDDLDGGDGDDVLDGGTGADRMIGGSGDDTFVVDNAGDLVVEAAGDIEGIDTVEASISYALGANVEHLTLIGAAHINATGNELANTLTGNDGDNVLDGGAEADQMAGGAGNDTYVVDNAADVVTERSNEGVDTVTASVGVALGAHVENLLLLGADDIDGSGNDLANVITGNAGNNILDGGTGADRLAGGLGNDTYLVDHAGDRVTEGAGEGTDTVRSTISYALADNIEQLVLVGTGNLDGIGNGSANTITGTSGNNLLDGGAGADLLTGRGGDDTYIVDDAGDVVAELADEGSDTVRASVSYGLSQNVENLILTGSGNINGSGNDAANVITGNDGNNILDGGAEADHLVGGLGNDTYLVDNADDMVVEAVNEGIDSVVSSVSYSLRANVENLTLSQNNNIDGTGNSLANTLTGNAGHNVLDGGAGADLLIGGQGNDTYVIDQAGDTVVEASDEGDDTVRASIGYSLGANLENLVLTGSGSIGGTGNDLANTITGNMGDNTLDGGAGADNLAGGQGNDTYLVDNAQDTVTEAAGEGVDTVRASITYALANHVERLILTGAAPIDGTGNSLDNVLVGNDGGNVLDGGAGADDLRGGLGNDTYLVDNAKDLVSEAAGEGVDTVRASVSYTLSANVENLVLSGAGNISGIGNELANDITGNGGDNVLDGGAGADSLAGGGGNDTYMVDNANDLVLEGADQGVDTVNAAISYALGQNVENLTLTGSGDLSGIGNDLANTITGNNGNNVLQGSGGNDLMDGGAGSDRAVYLGSKADYVITRKADGTIEIRDTQDGRDGTDILKGIETLQFVDGTVTLASNAPSAPVVQGSINTINENAAFYTPVASVQSPNVAAASVVYSLSTNPGGKFAIDPASGMIGLVGDIDYEASSTVDPDLKTEFKDTPQERKYYLLAVTATDATTSWSSTPTTIKVYVNNVNEAPTGLSFTNGTTKATIGENAADGAVIGALQAVDPDGDSQFVYAFDTSGNGGSSGAGNAGGRFKIENGQLKVAALTDITKPETYTVTIKVTDKNGGPGATATYKDFLITVNPATGGNEEPVFGIEGNPATPATDTGPAVKPFMGITLSDQEDNDLTLTVSFTNAEGVLDNIGSTATVQVTDPDPTATTRTITLKGKAGDLQTFLDNITFDPANSTANSGQVTTQFSFTLKDDSHEASNHLNAVRVVTTIVDKSENAAPVIGNAGSAADPIVKEILDTQTTKPFDGVTVTDADSTTVTATIALDVDSKGAFLASSLNGFAYNAQTHTYSMTGTAETVQNALQGLVFDPRDRATSAVGDKETTSFTLTIADGEGGQATSNFIKVEAAAANRGPSDITLTGGLAAAEYAATGTLVGTLGNSDPNTGDQHTYTLTDSAGGRFKIVGNQLLVDNGFKLDFEQATAHAVTVHVSDASGASYDKSFTVRVDDVARELTAGSPGDDVFKAGKYNDVLGGGFGNDVLWGGAGKDTLTGGKGKDVFVFNTKLNKKTNLDKIKDFNVKDDTIWLDNAIFKKLGKGSELKPGKLNKAFFSIGDHAKDKNDYLIYDNKKGVLFYDADGSGAGKAMEIATLSKKLKMTYKDFFVI